MIVLASQSPRRRDLLTRAGWRFIAESSDIDEQFAPGLSPDELAVSLALQKGRDVRRRLKPALPLLAADTIVFLDGEPMGKPRDPAEARAMLRRLSGRAHVVVTGVAALLPNGAEHTLAVASGVSFRPLEEDEIARYVACGEPLDRAGAYAIQGVGAFLIDRVDGSFTNVVGLPLKETIDLLRAVGAEP